jgi:hypothetical protein
MDKASSMNLSRIIIISIMLMSNVYGESVAVKSKGTTIDAGIKPLYGVALGEFNEEYSNPIGIMLNARGLYSLDLAKGHLLPEVRTGWLHLSHKRETHRQLNILPLNINIIWDWERLHFNGAQGAFSIRPYAGSGLYYVRYTSDRKNEYGFDSGYQIGVNLEYLHNEARDFFFEVGIEHFLITEFDATLTGLVISVGIGCTFHRE